MKWANNVIIYKFLDEENDDENVFFPYVTKIIN